LKSSTSIKEAIKNRRSVRDYKDDPLTIQDVTQLLFAAQGTTNPENNLRATPSAGATYPIEIYLVAGNVTKLEPGIYKYKNQTNELLKITNGDKRKKLCNATLSQPCVKNSTAVIVICTVLQRTIQKYGEQAKKYVYMEVGAVAENIYLQAESLNIGTVFVGAFNDNKVKNIINAETDEEPLCIMPLGKK